jgi:hypothetical protein
MALSRARGIRRSRKPARKETPHLKDERRAAVRGRKEQGLGRAGRAGGTKSAGGHAGATDPRRQRWGAAGRRSR